MRKFLFLLIFIFSVSTASNVLAAGAWQSCSGTGPIGSVASVCQDLVKKYGEDYILSHTDAQDENTVVCYGKTEGGSGSPDLVGSACKTSAEEPTEEEAEKPAQESAPQSSTPSTGKKNQGGAHRDTKKPAKDGKDSHHCPAKKTYRDAPISSEDGPAIKMSPSDHRKTASYGSSQDAKDYRKKQRDLLSEGKLMDAIQMDVKDIRKKFGNKYDKGINQMLAYARTLNPECFKK
jgi:hypothetical protein